MIGFNDKSVSQDIRAQQRDAPNNRQSLSLGSAVLPLGVIGPSLPMSDKLKVSIRLAAIEHNQVDAETQVCCYASHRKRNSASGPPSIGIACTGGASSTACRRGKAASLIQEGSKVTGMLLRGQIKQRRSNDRNLIDISRRHRQNQETHRWQTAKGEVSCRQWRPISCAAYACVRVFGRVQENGFPSGTTDSC
jgi:hypothetical protein